MLERKHRRDLSNPEPHLQYRYITELSEAGIIRVAYCRSHNMVADILTKPLPQDTFNYYKRRLLLPALPIFPKNAMAPPILHLRATNIPPTSPHAMHCFFTFWPLSISIILLNIFFLLFLHTNYFPANSDAYKIYFIPPGAIFLILLPVEILLYTQPVAIYIFLSLHFLDIYPVIFF